MTNALMSDLIGSVAHAVKYVEVCDGMHGVMTSPRIALIKHIITALNTLLALGQVVILFMHPFV